jgi:hypothetical protein
MLEVKHSYENFCPNKKHGYEDFVNIGALFNQIMNDDRVVVVCCDMLKGGKSYFCFRFSTLSCNSLILAS